MTGKHRIVLTWLILSILRHGRVQAISPPYNLRVLQVDTNTATVAWAAPAEGADWFEARITADQGDSQPPQYVNTSYATWDSLEPGRKYTVEIVAMMDGSQPSYPAILTFSTVPSAPYNVKITKFVNPILNQFRITGSKSIMYPVYGAVVSWEQSDFGYFDDFVLKVDPPHGTVRVPIQLKSGVSSQESKAKRRIVWDLLPGVFYTFAVQSKSNGVLSGEVTGGERMPPEKPGTIKVEETRPNYVIISWEEEHRGILDGYTVETDPEGGVAVQLTDDPTHKRRKVQNLIPGTKYTIEVYSTMAGLLSFKPSKVVFFTPPATPVGPVVNDEQGTESTHIRWKAPPGKVDYYEVVYYPENRDFGRLRERVFKTSANLTILDPGSAYNVHVYAVSNDKYSSPLDGMAYTRPLPPRNVIITSTHNSIQMSWDTVYFDGGAKVVYYPSSSETTENVTTILDEGVTEYTVTDLNPGTGYTLEIYVIKNGVESDPITIETKTTPTNTKAPPSDNPPIEPKAAATEKNAATTATSLAPTTDEIVEALVEESTAAETPKTTATERQRQTEATAYTTAEPTKPTTGQQSDTTSTTTQTVTDSSATTTKATVAPTTTRGSAATTSERGAPEADQRTTGTMRKEEETTQAAAVEATETTGSEAAKTVKSTTQPKESATRAKEPTEQQTERPVEAATKPTEQTTKQADTPTQSDKPATQSTTQTSKQPITQPESVEVATEASPRRNQTTAGLPQTNDAATTRPAEQTPEATTDGATTKMEETPFILFTFPPDEFEGPGGLEDENIEPTKESDLYVPEHNSTTNETEDITVVHNNQTVTIRDGFKTICEPNNITVFVDKNVIGKYESQYGPLHLNDDNVEEGCRGVEYDLYYRYTIAPNILGCGSEFEVNETHVNFTNTVSNRRLHQEWYKDMLDPTGAILIGRKSYTPFPLVHMNIYCTFPLDITVHTNYSFIPDIAMQIQTFNVSGKGQFSAAMQLYKDSQYKYPHFGPPVLQPNEMLRVGVTLLENKDESITVAVRKCWATPVQAFDYDTFYSLIGGYCPIEQALEGNLTILENGKSKRARWQGPVFKFVKFREVWLHCELKICFHGSCDTTCDEKENSRVRRSVGIDPNAAILSAGPIYVAPEREEVKPTPTSKTSQSSEGLSETTVIIIVAALCAVILISCIVFAVIVTKCYRKRNDGQSSEKSPVFSGSTLPIGSRSIETDPTSGCHNDGFRWETEETYRTTTSPEARHISLPMPDFPPPPEVSEPAEDFSENYRAIDDGCAQARDYAKVSRKTGGCRNSGFEEYEVRR